MAGTNSSTVTVYNAADTLTLSGGIMSSGSLQTSGAGSVIISNGVSVGSLQNSAAGNLSISGPLSTTGGLTNSGPGNMSIGGNATIGTTLTNSSTGTLTISGSATVGTTVTNSALAGNLSFNGGLTATTLTQSSIAGTVSIYQPANSSGSIGTINCVSGATLVLGGDPTSTTTVASGLGNAGANVTFNSGNWNLTAGGNYSQNLAITGGYVTRGPGQGSNNEGDFNSLVSLNVSGGTLISSNTYGIRMGNSSDAQNTGGNNFTGVQTAGLVTVVNSGNSTYSVLPWDPPVLTSTPPTRSAVGPLA